MRTVSTGIQQWILMNSIAIILIHFSTNAFLDSLSSNMFLPYIIQPTRITSHSKSIIDNIFSNYISQKIISCNLTSAISDHLPQFLIAPHIFSNAPNKKPNTFERDWSIFNREELFLTILQ